MFYDRAKIFIQSGSGGNGTVSFRREKYVAFGGPDGGDGGRGGSIYLRVDPHINTLIAFKYQQHFRADNGVNGQGSKKAGSKGSDLFIDVPPGTLIIDDESDEPIADLVEPGATFLIAKGGQGGLGNQHFATSTRQAPRIAEKGEPGVELWIRLELKVIADVGLIGFPNAGKSTLLSVSSAAKPKIADYPFTTLEPNLGVVQVERFSGTGFVMADIPGLIEGAAEGVGLGHEFLRHVERTRLLVHMIDGSGGLEGRDPIEDFHTINQELQAYSPGLAGKPQIVVINKLDLSETRENLERLTTVIETEGYEVYPISAVTGEGVPVLLRRIDTMLGEIPVVEPEVAAPHRRVYTLDDRNDDQWEVEQLAPHDFEIRGKKIERVTKMTDFENEEAGDRYQRILEASGISRKLEAIGIQPGDVVHVAGEELIWDQDLLEAEAMDAAHQRRRKTKRERTMARLGLLDEQSNTEEAF